MRKLIEGEVIELPREGFVRLIHTAQREPGKDNGWQPAKGGSEFWKVRFMHDRRIVYRWIDTDIDGLTETDTAKGYRDALMEMREWIDAKLEDKP